MWEKLKLMFHINSCPLCSALSTGRNSAIFEPRIIIIYKAMWGIDIDVLYQRQSGGPGLIKWPRSSGWPQSVGRIVECVVCGGGETISVEIEILISPPRSQGDCFVLKERCVKTFDILDHCHVYLIQPKEWSFCFQILHVHCTHVHMPHKCDILRCVACTSICTCSSYKRCAPDVKGGSA